MSLINFNTKIVLDALHGQVLAKRAKLVINVLVVGNFLAPLRLEHPECLREYGFGAHLARVWRLCQPIVRLLHRHARSLNTSMLGILVQAHLAVVEGLSAVVVVPVG